MKPHIIFVFPKFDDVCIAEPVGLCFLSAVLNKNKIKNDIDAGFLSGDNTDKVAARVIQKKPSHIGLSINTEPEKKQAKIFVKRLRKIGYEGMIFAGGLFAAIQTETLLKDLKINFLVIGDAEASILEIAKSFDMSEIKKLDNIVFIKNKKLVRNNIRKNYHGHLDDLPFMDRRILKKMSKFYKNTKVVNATLITNRGCIGNCKFCSIKDFYKSIKTPCYRERSIKNIVDEIEIIVNKYNITDFFFCSPIFLPLGTYGLKRAKEFNRELKRRKIKITYFAYLRIDHVQEDLIKVLKESGLRTVFVGVESFDNEILDFFDKEIKQKDIIKAMDILQSFGFSTNYDAKYRIKVGYITFSPIVSKNSLLQQAKIMQDYKIPAKKLTNIFEILNERDCGAKTIRKKDIKYNSMKNGDINKLYDDYLNFFREQLLFLEKIRSLQKSVNGISKNDQLRLYDFLDYFNHQCYEVFISLIKNKDIKKLSLNIRRKFEEENFEDLINRYISISKKDKLAYEYRLQRAINNPQFT